jgi:hypothetical protein
MRLCLQRHAEALLSIIEMSSCSEEIVMCVNIQKLDIVINFLFASLLVSGIFEVILRLSCSEQLIGGCDPL